ncbi:MAG: glycosyltransferase [Candidatus Omnitrophica bacterium]|nr:glycosyltransferase [Candidatus Omnitrophota bacterium]
MAERTIVRIITRLNIGGPARQAAGVSRTLGPLGWRTVLVTGQAGLEEGQMTEGLKDLPITHRSVPWLRRRLNPIRDFLAWLAILRILLKERPAILHTHMAKAGMLGRWAGVCYRLLTRSPLVMVHTFHGHVLTGYFGRFASRLFTLLERWMARGTDGLVAVGASVRGELLRLKVSTEEKIRVISLGLPLEDLLALPLPAAHRPFRIGLIGRLVPIKNHALLFQAVKLLDQSGNGGVFRFDLYGDGELRPDLEKLARDLGLQGSVIFHGWAKRMPEVYQALEAVVLTSDNEGTPVSVIEALAAGRPVVATDVGGVRDLLGPVLAREGKVSLCKRGILVPPGDAQTLASALSRLAEHPETAFKAQTAGRDFARENLSLERLTLDLDRLYRELLGEKTSHDRPRP